jgi:hypothetical protein
MKEEIFLKKYVNGSIAKQSCIQVIKKPKHYYSYHLNNLINQFVSIKGLIKYIDFQCRINPEDGGCKETPSSKKCCCHDCLMNVGYFRIMFEHDVAYYSRRFSVKTGFWRKGKGCILPHHKRSIICLTHNCNYPDKGYEHFSKGIYEVGGFLKSIRKSLIDICLKENES